MYLLNVNPEEEIIQNLLAENAKLQELVVEISKKVPKPLDHKVPGPLDYIHQADPSNIQCVAAANFELNGEVKQERDAR